MNLPMQKDLDRRGWVRQMAARSTAAVIATSACGLSPFTKTAMTHARQPKQRVSPIAIFAKHSQFLSFDELGKRLAAIDVDGIEATLRKGGQVEPKEMEQRLPDLCESLDRHGCRVIIAASDVNTVDDASIAYLEQLASNGIKYFRMAYYRYDLNKPILPQLDTFTKSALELSGVCKSLGVTALYQNHAGRNYVGAALWDLQRVLAELDPEHFAAALDIRHTTLELSQSFQAAYTLMRPHIRALYVKDFAWRDGQPTNVPLGQGRAKPLFDTVRSDGIVGPISLHMEYIDHRDRDLSEKCWDAIVADVATLKEWLAEEK